MTAWMLHAMFSSLAGWLGTAGIVVVICGVVAWFVPPLRRIAIEIAAVFIASATLYAKGNRDRARLEAARKEEAVQKAQKDYAQIDARPDSPDTVADKLRDGRF